MKDTCLAYVHRAPIPWGLSLARSLAKCLPIVFATVVPVVQDASAVID
jgi:hypothetical protein